MVKPNRKQCNNLKRYYLVEDDDEIYLTTREVECSYCLIYGYTAKQMAKAMKISPRTVENYIYNLKSKFKTDSRAGLIGKLLRCKMSDLVDSNHL